MNRFNFFITVTILIMGGVTCAEDNPQSLPSIPFKALKSIDKPIQYHTPPPPRGVLKEVKEIMNVEKAWKGFNVSGNGMYAAVLDTGLYSVHPDFAGHVILPGRNFTSTDISDTDDKNGHGTHVTGIISANGNENVGIAPNTNIIPIKVISDDGVNSDMKWIKEALEWIIKYNKKNQKKLITVINISAQTTENNYCWKKNNNCENPYDTYAITEIRKIIKQLRDSKVVVVAASGNGFGTDVDKGCFIEQGMAFPAIIPEVISVGSVYDKDINEVVQYPCGAKVNRKVVRNITPTSRRLYDVKGNGTDFFAPGSAVLSSGLLADGHSKSKEGTSQAAPAVAGVILLLQEFWFKQTNQFPTVEQVENWLHQGGKKILDVSLTPNADNVGHTGLAFDFVDANGALTKAKEDLKNNHL